MSEVQREYTCIICPNGCEIEVRLEGTEIRAFEGAKCKRGREYVEQELRDPRRNIASSVRVEGGSLPLVSVRLSGTVPLTRIPDVMAQIRAARLTAPVAAGQTVIGDVCGLGCDVITTKQIDKA